MGLERFSATIKRIVAHRRRVEVERTKELEGLVGTLREAAARELDYVKAVGDVVKAATEDVVVTEESPANGATADGAVWGGNDSDAEHTGVF